MRNAGRNDPCTHGGGGRFIFADRELPCVSRADAGFAYLGLLFLLAIMGIASAAALQVGAAMQRRAAEQALLNVGSEFSRALESYRRATPAGQPDAPATLQDLLKDPRFPGVVRHLRKIYADPVTGRQDWGLQRDEDTGEITGVYSLSDAKPIKIANFDLRFKEFAGKSSYQEWVFTGAQADTAPSKGPSLISPLDLMGDPESIPTDTSHQLPPGETSPRDLM